MHASTTELPNLAAYDVILVNSSGGKDSQAMLDEVCTLAEAAGVLDRITVLHCALGHVEWPGTSELARKQAEHYGVRYEERHREQGLLLDQVRHRGRWSSSSARYCTSDQKRGPARKLITQLVAELGDLARPARVLNCMGLRAEESRARLKKAQLSRDEAASSGRRTIDTWLPIHDWTETQVWQRIRSSGVPYHPAYDQGMSRHIDRTTARHTRVSGEVTRWRSIGVGQPSWRRLLHDCGGRRGRVAALGTCRSRSRCGGSVRGLGRFRPASRAGSAVPA
jgi:3'-phosphoadenosine 5'-phosphosulfate sulfotransferase (PAPS reductase)/FAD synthetase